MMSWISTNISIETMYTKMTYFVFAVTAIVGLAMAYLVYSKKKAARRNHNKKRRKKEAAPYTFKAKDGKIFRVNLK